MRSMWKGAISFGLVMIPVRLYAATEQKDISFRQVHRLDGGRIRFRRVCSVDGEEVPYEDVAKGYELPTGEMVVLTEEDMADLPLPTTRNIEVVNFTPADQLDPILFNRSYYVEPEAAGTRAYVLLRDALEQSGRVAIARVALRQRESLATLRVLSGVMVLETLLWPDEVRDASFPFLEDEVSVRPQELSMAASLIDSMTVDFDPDEYRDGYREAVAELVAAKTEGRELVQPSPLQIAAGESTSLADVLRASLEAARGGDGDGGAAAGDAAASDGAGTGRSGDGAKARTVKAGSGRRTSGTGAPASDGAAGGGSRAKGSSARSTPARSTAAGSTAAKSTAARSTAAKSTTAKSAARGKTTPAKTSAAQKPASAAKPAAAKSAPAGRGGTAKPGGAKAASARTAAAKPAASSARSKTV